ncbi:hypothetical protein C0Q70_16351 [Pomacea canaliculata]|uniref:EGF-like domain-containing protein n=1 Tax=Pomacea canaliculata TaxID=400727 RepID=A0A2T7NPI9_POMCA|nr:hypothetical protein C0Q70_16351 [Pomacea canaliculata]
MASKFRTYLLLLQVTSQARSLSTTQPPTSGDSGCSPGTVCHHGYCPAESLSCLCHSGWAGFYCEEPCPPGCEHRGACQTNPEGKAICWCEPGYGYVNGSGCVHVTATPETRTNRENTVTTEYSDSPPAVTIVTAASVLPPSNTGLELCEPGFPCFHGKCQTAPNIECVCDKGWEGVFCQNQCPLECGLHGRCQRVAGEDSAMFCDCVHGYEGDLCDKMTIDRIDEMVNLSDTPSDMATTVRSLSDASTSCVPIPVCMASAYCCPTTPHIAAATSTTLGPTARRSGPFLAVFSEIIDAGEVEVTWYWYVGAASVVFLLVLVLALVVLPYYMFRRGHLLMMKILYHFQSYEDDGKDDAAAHSK